MRAPPKGQDAQGRGACAVLLSLAESGADITKSISKDYGVLVEEGGDAGVALRHAPSHAPSRRTGCGAPPPLRLCVCRCPAESFAAARRAGALRRLAAGGDGDTELSPFRSYAGPGYDSEAPRFKRRFKVSALLQRRRAAVR